MLLLAALPLHDGKARRSDGALRHAEQRAHAELLHFLFGQDFHFDAQFFQLARLFRKVHRPEHVCRLVDQIARQGDTAGNSLRFRKGFLGRS